MGPVLNSMIQPLAHQVAQAEKDSFWNAYTYTCNNIAETLRVVALLLGQNPTASARFLLQTTNLIAKPGPGYLQIYPCSPLAKDMYKFEPMKEDNCTEFIPMTIYMGGRNHTGYLDITTNVVHAASAEISCQMRKETLLIIDGQLYSYHHNGNLTLTKQIHNLITILNVNLGATPPKIHETIYSRAHRLNWQQFSDHSSLNKLVATLSRQKQVLEAMGVSTDEHRSFESNVIESKEEMLGRAYFGFLFGGHVANGFEVWTLIVNCFVTLVVAAFIARKIWTRCLSDRITLRREIVAAADIEGQVDDDTIDEDEIEAGLQEDTPMFFDRDEQVMSNIAEIPPQAPLVPTAPSHVSYAPPYPPAQPLCADQVRVPYPTYFPRQNQY